MGVIRRTLGIRRPLRTMRRLRLYAERDRERETGRRAEVRADGVVSWVVLRLCGKVR